MSEQGATSTVELKTSKVKNKADFGLMTRLETGEYKRRWLCYNVATLSRS